jgi:hypothetical protein
MQRTDTGNSCLYNWGILLLIKVHVTMLNPVPQKSKRVFPFYNNCKRIFLLSFFTFFILIGRLPAQCIATSTVDAGSVSNDNSIGNIAFSNPGNATPSDNIRASAQVLISLLNGNTNYLKATGFGFNIPDYCGICGVVVEIEKRAGGLGIGAWIRDNEVKLVKNGTIVGNNLANSGVDWNSTDAYQTYGASNNLWGTTLTPADVNASNFGVVISAAFKGLALVLPSAQVDNIRMTIYYDPTLPTHLISFTSSLKNNIVHLEWKTADEEDHEFITLQRSVTGQSQWIDISRFEMQTGNNGKQYSYNDALTEKGNYYYRLQITLASRQTILSEIKEIEFTQTGIIFIYPNPADYYIILNNIQNLEKVNITNLYLQQFKMPVEKTGNTSCRINIQQLPKGVYIVIAGSQKIRFLKE